MGKINFKRAAARTVGVSAGVIGGQKLVPMIPIADRRIKGGLMIIAGASLSELAATNSKGMVADLGEGSGMGLVAAGATELYAGFNPNVSGVYGDDDKELSGMYGEDDDEMSGYDDDEEMNGTDDDQSLDGLDDLGDPIIEGGQAFINGHHKKHSHKPRHHHNEEEENEEEEDGDLEGEEENGMYGSEDEEDVLIN